MSRREVAFMHQISQRNGVQRLRDGIADLRPEKVRGAGAKPIADNLHLTLGRADHWRDWTFEGANDLTHPHRLRRPGEPVPTMRAPGGLYESLLSKRAHQLFQILLLKLQAL